MTARESVEDLKTLTGRAAARWGERPCLRFDQTGDTLSFLDIERDSNRIGRVLIGLGVEPGQTVGVMLRNHPAFPLTWLALSKIGATMVPINVFYRTEDARYLLDHAEVRTVVTAKEFLPLIRELVAAGLAIDRILLVDGDRQGEDVSVLPHMLADADPDPLPGPLAGTVAPEALANVQYTSGTTGLPKGCMLSNRYWLNLASKMVGGFPAITERDIMLTAQPFYYMDPQWNVATALLAGAQLVVLDRFHPSSFWQKVRAYDVTFFYCLGSMPTLMLKMPPDPADRDNKVTRILCSAIPANRHAELEARWGVPWYEAYGTTETGGDLVVGPEDHDELVGSACIGRPMMNREAQVVDADGKRLPAGETGELVLRGPGMMDGYFKNDEATRAGFRDGWHHTGDLARTDEAGRFYYVSRIKDMIRRSGENIAAAEVEDILGQHPAVRLAACLPVPDDIRGEEVKAYIVLQPGETADSVPPQDLIAHCDARLAYFKVPRYWTYEDDLPRTPSERVEKGKMATAQDDLRAGAWDRVDSVWR